MSEPIEKTEGQLLSEEYSMSGSPASLEVAQPQARTVGAVAFEIRNLQSQARGIILNYAIEIGRRLEEAKAMLPHGEWGVWLKRELDYSPSTAQNFMKVYREFGNSQQSLFGGIPKSQTFGNLTFSKALSLLAISDEEERERFAIENDVEHMSVRELNEAIKAKNKAEEKAEQLQEQLTDQARVYEAKLSSAEVEAEQARASAKAAQEALDKQRDKANRLQEALSEANASAQAAGDEYARLLRKLEELRNRPAEANTEAEEAAHQAAIDEMTEKVKKAEDAKKQAEEKAAAAEESLAAVRKELEEQKARAPEVREPTLEEKAALTADAVEKARAEDAEQIRNLEKKLAAADPNVAEFKVWAKSWQKDYREMMKVLDRIAQDDVKQAARNLVKAALEQMGSGQGEQIT